MISFENERFHLRNEFFSYVIEVSRGKYLLHRYWGKPLLEFRDSAALQKIDRGFSPQLNDFENERTYSLDVLPQEYPVRGHTDFRIPATKSLPTFLKIRRFWFGARNSSTPAPKKLKFATRRVRQSIFQVTNLTR